MPYITREDGERFIIPSYRDVITEKKLSQLKKDILILAESYGNYITLQKKAANQYEVAFSPEPGALLGESVWQYFKRPRDLVYCEVMPNSAEAILVIVKAGSVYLDGSFAIDTIPDELVVFQTQQNNFEIFIYGDAPISEHPEEGKFSFDASSVKSFTYLDRPVFPHLPIVRAFQLQPVDIVLRSQGIGVFPLRKLVIGIVTIGVLWIGWLIVSTHKEELPSAIISVVNPYQVFISTLTSPDPSLEIKKLANTIILFNSIPGWTPNLFTYANGSAIVNVSSLGMRTNVLFTWAKKNNATVNIASNGFVVTMQTFFGNRLPPNAIYELKSVISNLIDRLSYVLPGNPIRITATVDRGKYKEMDLTIEFAQITPTTLSLIGDQLKRLPLVLIGASVSVTEDTLTGKIDLKALGN